MKYELPSTELIVIEENDYLKFGEYLNDMQCDDTVNKLNLDDLEYVKKLQQENQKFQERIEYLERSNNRREDTIIGYRLEDIGIVAELEELLKEETKLSDDYFVGECHTDYTDVLEKIQKLKEKYK